MKKLLFLLLLLPFISHAQPDYKKDIYIKDKRCFEDIKGTYDIKRIGNRIFGVTQSIPFGDARLVIMNMNFDTIKTVIYGGSQEDLIYQVNELPNGNILLTGIADSEDGEVWYGRQNVGTQVWLMEVDSNGNIIKGKTFGGSQGSGQVKTLVSTDGNIYMIGPTTANDYEFTRPVWYGPFAVETYLVKLDTAFNIIWTKFLPTITDELGTNILEITNNNFLFSYMVADTAQSVLGSQAHGGYDCFILKLDKNGNELNKLRIGGSSHDGCISSIYDTLNQRYYFINFSNSMDAGTTFRSGQNNSIMNIWIVVTDTNFNVIQSKAYGTKTSSCQIGPWHGIALFQGNIWVTTRTTAGVDEFFSNQYPLEDTFDNTIILMFDTSANLIAKMGLKSNYTITITKLLEINNELFAFGGTGDFNAIQPNTFACDTTKIFYFTLKLGEAPLSTKNYKKENKPELFTLYPNPTDNELSIKINEDYNGEKYIIEIYTLEGKKIDSYKGKISNEPIKINTSNYASGKYLVQVKIKNQKETNSFIKK